MRNRLAASALLVITCIATRGDLFACGDKFLVVGRATRFKHASVPRRPAVILIFADPASNLPRALANVPVDATLRKAGYQPTSVASANGSTRRSRRRHGISFSSMKPTARTSAPGSRAIRRRSSCRSSTRPRTPS